MHSPTWDEVGHLPAGLSHWRCGRFDLYRVNPPLVRMIAALPVLAVEHKENWNDYQVDVRARAEFEVGKRFIEANGSRSFWLFTLARWSCLPFTVVGAVVCYKWGCDLYGASGGMLAATLWCFDPNIVTHAQLVTPDLAATSLGLWACYWFWKWQKCPHWTSAFLAGVALGLAQSTKFSLVILFPLWPLLWSLRRWSESTPFADRWLPEFTQLCVIFAIALWIINAVYGFEGSFRRLGEYEFVSAALKGHGLADFELGNRFAKTPLSLIPVLLPRNYVQGIDVQKGDFERKMWSYLRGEWKMGGWWYYYVYAFAIKTPVGTLTLLALAMATCICRRRSYTRCAVMDEVIVLSPAILIFSFVSAQTGFNHHLRYVLPAFPFLFIWAGRVFGTSASDVVRSEWPAASRMARGIGVVALVGSVTSTLFTYPHTLSYFNEFVGGPKQGHRHLVDSNIDWGQDLLKLKRKLERAGGSHLDGVAYSLGHLVKPETVGVYGDWPLPSRNWNALPPDTKSNEVGPRPGRYAVSIGAMRSRDHQLDYFLQLEPSDYAGYGIYIYDITDGDVARVRE